MKCSFCYASPDVAKILIKGEDNVYICEKCVAQCVLSFADAFGKLHKEKEAKK
jgi:ATP-dependent protease Clp ATPase subunit